MLLPKPQNLAMMLGLSFFSYSSAGQDLFTSTSSIEVSLTSLKKEHLEFSPVFYDNGLLFVTSQKKSRKNKRYFDIAYAPYLEDGLLGSSSFMEKLNTKYHEGPLVMSSDYQCAYITRSSLDNGEPITDSLGFNRLDIYKVDLSGKSPIETILPFNNKDFSCVHPALSQDETKLYFSSDRPGGFGGYDIWYSEQKDGAWGVAINLGEKVNSASNELFPVLFQDSYLFFASNRPYQDSLLGLDIYQCQLDSNQLVADLDRLSAPINSTHDDFGLIIDKEKAFGYFSSSRKGTDDIFRYDIKVPEQPKTIRFSLVLSEKKTLGPMLSQQVPVDDVHVALFSNTTTLSALSDDTGVVGFDIFPNVNYSVICSKANFESDTFSILESEDFVREIEMNAEKKTCQTQYGYITTVDGKSGLAGVSVTIQTNIGYEIHTISNEEGNFTFCLPVESKYYKLNAIKDGFQSYNIERELGAKSSFSLIPIKDNSSQASFVLENVYYDFNDAKIKEHSTDELVRLAQILKEHPAVDIRLVAYTDSRGTKKYNERLARHRARAAKAFLVKLGIKAERIKPVGRGEVNIRNRCKNGVKCSEKEHQYNRRTEVIFINPPDDLQLIRKIGVTTYSH